jgi:2-keto-4-pentenoate hydratase
MSEADEHPLTRDLFISRDQGQALQEPKSGKLSRTDGLKVQLQVLSRFQRKGESVGGWKVGFTSGKSRDAMGDRFRPFGYVLGSRVFRSGAEIPVTLYNGMLEPELALILGAPLRGVVDVETAKAAVRGVAAAFEVNEVRAQIAYGSGTMIADGLANWGVVIGEERPVSAFRDGLTVDLFEGGKALATGVYPTGGMDNPFDSLCALSAQLSAHGLGLEAGQVVITGSFTHYKMTAPAEVRADFEGVGDVFVRLV